MKKYSKAYSTPEEYSYRFTVFQRTLERIEASRVTAGHQVGLTKFSDLTKEEFRAKYTGLKFSTRVKNYQTKN